MRTGIIEGFFGEPWAWEARHQALPFLAAEGLSLFLYAPKADRHLRARWDTPHDGPTTEALARFGRQARSHGVDFAIGLSPLGLYERWGEAGQADLLRRVDELVDIGIDGLGLFFDDMRGDLPRLAETQAAMCRAVHAAHPDLRLWLCPTYYTPDPVLDRVFGARPERYLETLGEGLPEAVEVFWTGERVCSTSYAADDLRVVRERLGRPLAIWDNYPVNDGPRMCRRLHLRPPGGRGPELQEVVSTWCINPMNQPVASRLPIAAMVRSLAGGTPTTRELATELFGEPIAAALVTWADGFQDEGLDRWQDDPAALAAFRALEGPLPAEIVHWLEGRSVVGPECLTDTED